MQKLNNLKWRQIYIAYGLVLVSAIFLFFVGRYEAGFSAFMHGDPKDDLLPGLTLNKVVLFILDFSLWAIIVTPLKIEDERVEKIRNYAIKQTFYMGLMSAIGLGVLMSGNFNPLIYVLVVQCYYLLLFELCLYRDSRIVYLTPAEQQAKAKKNKKKFMIYTIIQSVLLPPIGMTVVHHYHRPELMWISMFVLIGIMLLVVTVYTSWKR